MAGILEVLIYGYVFLGLIFYFAFLFGNIHKCINHDKLILFSVFWLPISIYYTIEILRGK